MAARLPPLPYLLAEAPRAAAELAALGPALPWLALSPRGDGHPVLALPGFFATDGYMAVLRTFLRWRDYDAQGWRAGRNWGHWDALERIVLPEIERLAERSGRKVSLVGASMGSLYARAAAARLPHLVRCVVTFASAATPAPEGTYVTPLYQAVTAQPGETLAAPPAPVPCTSLFSRSDGMSDWRPNLLPAGAGLENIEVVSSHHGMAWHPAVLYAVADRLAQPEGGWQPFRAPAWARPLYPRVREADA
jgi:pimeloyl-ACP methyl ester carboxylesterase